MIDFRYHLVSLVAVFMALAVGIVLGAGPLGQEISSTLEAQVRDLREERNGLRAQLDQTQARESLKDEVLQLVTPTLVSGQLTGRRVALVTLPGVDRNIGGQLQDQLTTAGAEVVMTARLEDSWANPDDAATRHEVAAELAPTLSTPEPREGAEPTAETVIASALTGQNTVVGSAAWLSAIERLGEVGFIDVNWENTPETGIMDPPDSVVVITGDLTTQQVEEAAGGDARLQQSLDLIAAFGQLGIPTVVAGSGTESFADPVQSAESPVVRGLRAESAVADLVSSVDNVEGPTGKLSTVLGLRWATDGQPGHWGLGTDAQGPAPSVPAPLVPEEEDDTIDLGPILPTGSSTEEGSVQGGSLPEVTTEEGSVGEGPAARKVAAGGPPSRPSPLTLSPPTPNPPTPSPLTLRNPRTPPPRRATPHREAAPRRAAGPGRSSRHSPGLGGAEVPAWEHLGPALGADQPRRGSGHPARGPGAGGRHDCLLRSHRERLATPPAAHRHGLPRGRRPGGAG